jgi:hypothetical protein
MNDRRDQATDGPRAPNSVPGFITSSGHPVTSRRGPVTTAFLLLVPDPIRWWTLNRCNGSSATVGVSWDELRDELRLARRGGSLSREMTEITEFTAEERSRIVRETRGGPVAGRPQLDTSARLPQSSAPLLRGENRELRNLRRRLVGRLTAPHPAVSAPPHAAMRWAEGA